MKCKRTNFLRLFLSLFVACFSLEFSLIVRSLPLFSFFFLVPDEIWGKRRERGERNFIFPLAFFSPMESQWARTREGEERRRAPGLMSFPPKTAKLCGGLPKHALRFGGIEKRRFPLIFDFLILDTESVPEFGWSLSETLNQY